MRKLIRYLKDFKWQVALIVALLVVQAFCELALPQYMSDIVDIGIQQGGIAEIAPTEMRKTTFEALSLFMTGDEMETVSAAYAENSAGNLELQKQDRETLDALNDAFSIPMVMLSGAQEQQQVTAEQLVMAAQAGMVTKESMAQMRDAAMAQMDETSLSLLGQRALLMTKAEYEALGMDMSKLQTNYLLTTGLKMMGITLLTVAAAIAAGYLSARTAAGIGMTLRGKVFNKVVSFSSGDMEKFSTASLITRSTTDIQRVQMSTVMILRMVLYAPILGIGGVIKVAATRTGLSWIIVVAVALLMTLIGVLMVIAMPKFKKVPLLMDRINLVAREILSGLLVVRAFSREKRENERFGEANEDLMKTQLFTNRVMSTMMPLMMLIMNAITLSIVWFGAKGVDLGNLQVGNLMAFMTYAMQIVMSFLMLSMLSIMLPQALVSAGRIDEVLEKDPSVADKEKTLDNGHQWQGVVAFEDVSFRYPDAEEDVLRHITFTARPGQTTAIIGSTGSGKSTVLNLIPRFYDVTGGRVTMDGVDIRDLSQQKLRGLLGYVPQKGMLFSGTIESNIKYAGETVTDADMIEAAEIAQARDFIEEKADGYQDPIAQGGTNVSGGQKQRLSIARAIAKKPRVLLFDDSFSALDYKTDVKLRRALNEHVKDATVIIVAQRISTVLHADQIVVMHEGNMAGIGTHGELMETCQVYQDIAKSQLSDAELKGGKGA